VGIATRKQPEQLLRALSAGVVSGSIEAQRRFVRAGGRQRC
jgi:hypothetical protein